MIGNLKYFMTLHHLLPLILCSFVLAVRADIPLTLTAFNQNSKSVIATGDAVLEIRGRNSLRATPERPVGPGRWVLEMEYFSIGGVPAFFVMSGGPNFSSKEARQLKALGHSETWSRYAALLNPEGKDLIAGWRELRIDLPLDPNAVLQVRNPRLRLERPGEFELGSMESPNAASKDVLNDYLDKDFPSRISSIAVETTDVVIRGRLSGFSEGGFIAHIPMEYILGKSALYESLVPLQPNAEGIFEIRLPRIVARESGDYDRLTSRWQIFRKVGETYVPMSHARYAETVVSRIPQPLPVKPLTKKGLGGWSAGRVPGELKELGIAAVTVNLFGLDTFVSLTPEANTKAFQWQGRTYYAREKVLQRHDETFREAQSHGVMVSAILLVSNPANSSSPLAKLLGHPDAVAEGTYGMPNVTSREGIELYGAIMNLITERWSKDDGIYGRVHHWIIHNEVDAGWVWTNVGSKDDVVYMDLYQRSMRLTDLIARQYDSNSRPFITLTHHWGEAGNKNWYGSKRMIELLVNFCSAEGDFPWALAYHPYPQDLRNPRTWEDHQVTFDFETPKITPRNLEVLDAYMKTPDLLYHGKVRPVHLSENGFNSPDYSAKSLEDQAAGMALAWKKIDRLSSIEQWQYHNWIDNRSEGGLRIGLRKFPDETGDPLGKKPIWHLYKALGTSDEDRAAGPYLKTIGIASWNEVIYREIIR